MMRNEKKATERASNHRVFEQLTNIIAAADFERKRAGVPESLGSLNRDDGMRLVTPAHRHQHTRFYIDPDSLSVAASLPTIKATVTPKQVVAIYFGL